VRRRVGWLLVIVPWCDVLTLHIIGLVRFGAW
jgi:hypothetical protein